MSEEAGTAHHTILCDTPALVENLLASLHAYDLPTFGQAMTSLYLLFRAIKQGATVALSGESADEFFGGYHWLHRDVDLNTPTFPWLLAFLGPGKNPLSWLSAELIQQVQPTEHIQQQYQQAIAEVPRLAGEDARASRIRELFYLTLTHFLPIMLDRKDRMSMATGLEVRVPFCDYRLVEYVWNIPLEMKTVDALEKGILRRALMNVLPEDVRLRKKSAYPSAHSPAYEEATRQWARAILNDTNAPIQPLLDARVVQAAVETSEAPPAAIFVSWWERIIHINEWLKTYQVSLAL